MQEIFDVNTYDTPCTLNVSSLLPDFKGKLYVIFSKIVKFFDAPQCHSIFSAVGAIFFIESLLPVKTYIKLKGLWLLQIIHHTNLKCKKILTLSTLCAIFNKIVKFFRMSIRTIQFSVLRHFYRCSRDSEITPTANQ